MHHCTGDGEPFSGAQSSASTRWFFVLKQWFSSSKHSNSLRTAKWWEKTGWASLIIANVPCGSLSSSCTASDSSSVHIPLSRSTFARRRAEIFVFCWSSVSGLALLRFFFIITSRSNRLERRNKIDSKLYSSSRDIKIENISSSSIETFPCVWHGFNLEEKNSTESQFHTQNSSDCYRISFFFGVEKYRISVFLRCWPNSHMVCRGERERSWHLFNMPQSARERFVKHLTASSSGQWPSRETHTANEYIIDHKKISNWFISIQSAGTSFAWLSREIP